MQLPYEHGYYWRSEQSLLPQMKNEGDESVRYPRIGRAGWDGRISQPWNAQFF